MSNIESTLNETRVFNPPAAFVAQANVSSMASYLAMCKEAEQDYAGYWAKLAREQLLWKRPFTKVLDESKAPFYKWFEDGELNVSYNCLDKHLETQPNKDRASSSRRTTVKCHPNKLPRAARTRLPIRQRPEIARHKEGRPRHHLHADEHRSGGCDAGLRAHRRDPLGGVRRFFLQKFERAHHRCRGLRGDYRRCDSCAAVA